MSFKGFFLSRLQNKDMALVVSLTCTASSNAAFIEAEDEAEIVVFWLYKMPLAAEVFSPSIFAAVKAQ